MYFFVFEFRGGLIDYNFSQNIPSIVGVFAFYLFNIELQNRI